MRRLQVFLTVVGCDIQALRGVYMIGCGFSLMIPSAEAARNTDDLRTTGTPGNGAEDGGCGQRDSKGNEGNGTQCVFVTAKMSKHEIHKILKSTMSDEVTQKAHFTKFLFSQSYL